jgi:hypothetical protein
MITSITMIAVTIAVANAITVATIFMTTITAAITLTFFRTLTPAGGVGILAPNIGRRSAVAL